MYMTSGADLGLLKDVQSQIQPDSSLMTCLQWLFIPFEWENLTQIICSKYSIIQLMVGLCLMTSLRREKARNEDDQQASGPAMVPSKSFSSFCLDSPRRSPALFLARGAAQIFHPLGLYNQPSRSDF